MKIIAHRGLHHTATENTTAAFIEAIHAGAKWVECDVWPCLDGTPVVIHDSTLDRTTRTTGSVSARSSLELSVIGVPALAELLDLCSKSAVGLLIEIKPPAAAEFSAKVETIARRYSCPWILQSFHPENIRPAKQTALLVEKREHLKLAIGSPWTAIHAHHSLIDREIVRQLHDLGRTIGAWTVNHPDDIRRMIDLGVDVLITDEPVLAVELTQSPGASAAAVTEAAGAPPSARTR